MRILLVLAFWGGACGAPERPRLALASSGAMAVANLGHTPLVLHLNFSRAAPLTRVQQTAFLVALEHKLGIGATWMRAWPGRAELHFPGDMPATSVGAILEFVLAVKVHACTHAHTHTRTMQVLHARCAHTMPHMQCGHDEHARNPLRKCNAGAPSHGRPPLPSRCS